MFLVFVAVVSFCCYQKHKRRHQPLLTQPACRATTTTITTNNPQVQSGVRAHPENYQTQPTYPQQPYPPQQGYIPQQQLYTNTVDYPQQSETTAGMLVEEVLFLCVFSDRFSAFL